MNFNLSNVDTDSISICKPDGSFISKEERKTILDALNAEFPEKIRFTDDGYFPDFIVLAAKNYIMRKEDGTVKLKGSSLKDAKMEPIIKEMNSAIITDLLENQGKNLLTIYLKYIKLVSSITDIKPWASKKTISAKTLVSERENEAKIMRAIAGSEYVEGDKVYCFYDQDDELVLVENFKGIYSKERLYGRLFDATEKFSPVLDRSQFLDYTLKRNENALRELHGLPPIIKEKKPKNVKKLETGPQNVESR